MIRLLQVCALSCLLATFATAAPVSVAIHAGSTVPNLRDRGGNEFSSGWSTRVGLFFGAGAEVKVTPAVSVLAEVNYSAQGGKKNGLQAIDFPLPDGTSMTAFASFKNTAKLDYVEIPVMGRLGFGPEHLGFVEFGPYVGFLLSAKNVLAGSGPVFQDPQGTQLLAPEAGFDATIDNKSSLHTVNWGLQAGLGARHPFGRGTALLEVRGELGLMNIQRNPEVDGKNGTGALIMALGYEFPVPFGR